MTPEQQLIETVFIAAAKHHALCGKRVQRHADELQQLLGRENKVGITPDPELDAFMKAEVRTGKRESIVTDFVIKMLGLDVSPGSMH